MTYDREVPAEVRAAFAAGPTEEPALRLTAEEVLRGGRRALRRRRTAGAGAGALAVAAVVGAVSVLPGLPAPGGDQVAGRPASPTTTPSEHPSTPPAHRPSGPPSTVPQPSPSPDAAPTSTLSPQEQAATLIRLTAVLRRVVVLPAGGTMAETTPLQPGLPSLQFVASQRGYKAAADVADARGRGQLLVWVDEGRTVLGQPCAGQPECSDQTTTDGDRIVATVRREGAGTVNSVRVIHPDGRSVIAESANFTMASTSGKGVPIRAERATPPWTAAQLAAIARTPDLVP